MDTKEILDRIENIESKISELPKGYISRKTINGKSRSYLQWQENGMKKSKYINEKDIHALEEQIEARKELQAELKELKRHISKDKESMQKPIFNTTIKVGESLERYVNEVKDFKKRNCFAKLEDYLYGNQSGKVLILYGLRRTGKTTLIRQAILEMSAENKNRSAFIQITQNNSLADVNFDLRYLESKGYKYVFIDEVTLMNDFIEGAALFSDIFASSGMKIVLSGTDSLEFILAEDDQLYDRCVMLHTTFIPYREFESVLGIKGIDEYIRYGGTMSMSGVNYNDDSTFATERKTNEYVDSAISKNIQHSLKCYQYEGRFRNLEKLYEKNELTSAINRVVEDINHRFTLEVLTRDFVSNDLGISAKNLRNDKDNGNDILDRIDKTKFTNRLKEILEIKNKHEQSIEIKDIHRIEIKEYLELLDLIVDVDVFSIPVSNEKKYRTILSQPGMRYSIAESLVKSLLMDERFQDISINDRNYVISRILSEIKGRMLEDIVLLETKISNPKKEVFKLQFSIGEFDMVVVDTENVTCDIFEVKYSDKIVDSQYKNLVDTQKCTNTEFRYGKILNRYVIYRGENKTLENGIKYINVESFLRGLY